MTGDQWNFEVAMRGNAAKFDAWKMGLNECTIHLLENIRGRLVFTAAGPMSKLHVLRVIIRLQV